MKTLDNLFEIEMRRFLEANRDRLPAWREHVEIWDGERCVGDVDFSPSPITRS